MQESQSRALKAVAYALGILVYLGGIAYAEARAFSLFSRTIDPELLPIAILGIVALGITAIAAPIAHHWGTSPGLQRLALDVFYFFDLVAMAANAVLDAALHSNNDLTTLLAFWNAYVLPALPLACLAGWTIFFMLDPAHRKRDMLLAARTATEEVLTSRVIEQMKATDLTDIVDGAARAAAQEIVGQTVGAAGASPTRLPAPAQAELVPARRQNGRRASVEDAVGPNA
jgi:hypothetical protein